MLLVRTFSLVAILSVLYTYLYEATAYIVRTVLPTLNLSDITSRLRTVITFVIVDL